MNAEQQDEYIVQALRMQGAMYEDDARKFLAEHDSRVRDEALAEAADYVERRRLARADIVTDFDRGRRAAEGCVVEELRGLAGAGEKATAAAATATPADFFVAGRTYTRTDRTGLRLRFVCEHLTTDPKVGDREAWGWLHRSDGTRRMQRMWDHDYVQWAGDAS